MPRVRDLDWRVDITDGEETHFADSVVGPYRAWTKDGVAYAILPTVRDRLKVGTTIEDALSHCQADFERSILSALA